MDRVERLRQFLIDRGFEGTQTFCSRNMVGDPMGTVYDDDGITVDYCHHYEYLEIFGLSNEEYRSLSDILDIAD